VIEVMRRGECISEKEKIVDGMGVYLRITICFLIALLASCMEQNELDYYPMSIGSKWEYVGKMKRGPGKIISVKSTGLIEGRETINGNEYYKLVTVYEGAPGFPPKTISYLRKTKDGIYLLAGEQKDKPELLSSPLPLKVGKTWKLATHSPTVKGEYRVEGIETVSLNDEQYEDCLKIYLQQETNRVKGERIDYVAPNIGVIKQLVTFGDVEIEVYLEKFTPGKN
jgi:hypothetical protein